MSATKISDLLPIPSGTRQPHPYQIFGLDDGEQDAATIKTAVQSVVSRLKAVKSETDPQVWKQAARLVKGAQEVLSDPEKKAQLDARFGVVAVEPPAAAASSDPLAALLPNANPLAPSKPDPLADVLPASNPMHPVETTPGEPTQQVAIPDPIQSDSILPPGLFAAPQQSDEAGSSDEESESESVSPSAPLVVKTPPKARRKRSMTGTLIGLAFALLAFAVVGGVVYFVLIKPGQVAITVTDNGFSISTQPQPSTNPPAVMPTRPVEPKAERPPRDPVMGGLNRGPAVDPQRDPSGNMAGEPDLDNARPDASEGSSADDRPPSVPSIGGAGGSNPGDAMEANVEPISPQAMSEGGAAEMPGETNIDTDPTMEPPTDEMIAQTEEALERVRELIRDADWTEMKPAIEAVLEQPMSEPQRQQAENLHAIADLASYYRGGIQRAIADLKIGNDFEVTEGFRIIVVETGPDRLVVRYNAKNQVYALGELPWSLAHKLASFSMPDNPSTEAAKAVYQAIAPNANQGYREQALQWLDEIQGEVEGADPQQLAETLRSLFSKDN